MVPTSNPPFRPSIGFPWHEKKEESARIFRWCAKENVFLFRLLDLVILLLIVVVLEAGHCSSIKVFVRDDFLACLLTHYTSVAASPIKLLHGSSCIFTMLSPHGGYYSS